jgi:hypothetical protein
MTRPLTTVDPCDGCLMEQGQDQLPGTPRYTETQVTRRTLCKNEVHGIPPPLAVNKKLTVTPLHCETSSVATLSRCKARCVNLALVTHKNHNGLSPCHHCAAPCLY